MRASALLFALGILCLAAGPAFARTVIVPDQVLTIQGAIDTLSIGYSLDESDTVLVRDGEYLEGAVAHKPEASSHRINLLPFDTVSDASSFPRFDMPRVRSFRTEWAQDLDWSVRGFHFLGPVSFIGGSARFEACRMDSGLMIAASNYAEVRGCQIWNGVDVSAIGYGLYSNTVIGGGIRGAGAGRLVIMDNYVVGPASAGITELSNDGNYIAGNTIVGTTEGIVTAGASVIDNSVTGCSGSAFRFKRFGTGSYTRNRVTRCGGHGFLIEEAHSFYDSQEVELLGNEILDVGGCGVFVEGEPQLSIDWNTIQRVGGSGISAANASPHSLVGNRITDAAGDGIVVLTLEDASRNVIGRCGRGIVADQIGADIGHNTIYACRGSGLVTHDYPAVDRESATAAPTPPETLWIEHSIFANNGGHGLEVLPGTVSAYGARLASRCNAFFGNASGPISGIPLGATDLEVDPMFCDASIDSVGLRENSPLLDAPGCGLIGALGRGCPDLATGTRTPPAPRPENAPLRLELLPPAPNPAQRGAVIGYTLPTEMSVRVQVLDVAGRVVADLADGTQAAGRHQVVWGGSATTVRAGVYFVRLDAGGRRFIRRAIITP